MAFLYEQFDTLKKMGMFNVDIPTFINDNLKYTVRPYQTEAFQRYVFFDTNDFDLKPNKPFHLLYNMATGSGKTLVMAGLMLYLYKKGYRRGDCAPMAIIEFRKINIFIWYCTYKLKSWSISCISTICYI